MADCFRAHATSEFVCIYESFMCVCVCVVSSLTASLNRRPFTVNPHIVVFHTSLVTQQWFCTPPPSGNTCCCPPILSPLGFPCTEHIAFNRVLGKEGLNNTGLDVGEVSSTCLPRSHSTNVSSHTLSLPPLTDSSLSPPTTHG